MLKKSKKIISTIAIAATLAVGCVPAYSAITPCAAADFSAYSSSSSSTTTSSAPAQNRHNHIFGHGCAMKILADISGKSVDEIMKEYPQKTAWQAAKAMGKLNDLKEEYLVRARVSLDEQVTDKKISEQDAAKIYEDLQRRVAAIDGVNIVITGRPNYRPSCPAQSSR